MGATVDWGVALIRMVIPCEVEPAINVLIADIVVVRVVRLDILPGRAPVVREDDGVNVNEKMIVDGMFVIVAVVCRFLEQ